MFNVVVAAAANLPMLTKIEATLKAWAPGIAVICIIVGAMAWMVGSWSNHSGMVAIGLKVTGTCMLAMALIFAAVSLIAIGTSWGK